MASHDDGSFDLEPVDPAALADHSESIVRLFAQHQRWLHGYLVALLGNSVDAEDVFQEVCVVMWKEHHKFKVGTNFVGWLSVIAYHQVQKFWRQKKRQQQLFKESTLGLLSEELPQRFELMEARRRALPSCIGKLRNSDRELVRRCYGDPRVTARQVASEMGRSENTVYKALNRIRRSLHECISRTTSAEGLT